MRRELVVLARWPVPGRCKRRLARGIGGSRAAVAQTRLMGHTIACCRRAQALLGASGEPQLLVAAEPLAPRAAQRWARHLGAGRGLRQGSGSLGSRMQRQLRRAQRDGAEQVVLIGSDLPALEAGDLVAAFNALQDTPLVLGPASDGGYWLIGIDTRPRRGLAPALWSRLFSGIAWGGDTVLSTTLALARHHGVRPALLQERNDLDQASDLRPWR